MVKAAINTGFDDPLRHFRRTAARLRRRSASPLLYANYLSESVIWPIKPNGRETHRHGMSSFKNAGER
jgi:hypothetical protein